MGIAFAAGIVAGGSTTYAWTSKGNAFAWGEGAFGQLGNGGTGRGFAPVHLPEVVGIGAGPDHACAWTITGALWCWGSNQAGQVGNNVIGTNVLTPVQIGAHVLGKVVFADGGDQHTCAINDDGWLFCWGNNTNGQVGLQNGYLTPMPQPTTPTLYNIVEIDLDYQSTCALSTWGNVVCFGLNWFDWQGETTGRTENPVAFADEFF